MEVERIERLLRRLFVGAVGGVLTYLAVRFTTALFYQWLVASSLGGPHDDGEIGVNVGPVIIATSLAIGAASLIYGLIISVADERMRPSASLGVSWVFWAAITFILTWVGLVVFVFARRWLPAPQLLAPILAIIWCACSHAILALMLEDFLAVSSPTEPPN